MDRSIFTKHEDKLYKLDTRQHMFQYPGVYQLLSLACIGADSFTLFSLIDLFFKQTVSMSMVITIAVAGVLNITAVLLAACLRNTELSLRMKKVFCTLLISIFILFFSATFSLRIASQEQMYGTSDDLDITIQSESFEQIAAEEEFKPSLAQTILAVILGLEPLGTSILCFYLGFEQSAERKRKHQEAQNLMEAEELIDHYKVMVEELRNDLDFDLESYDEELYTEMIAIIIQYGELAKNKAIRKLSEHDGTPEGISYLMEGEYLKQKKGAEYTDSASAVPANEEVTTKIKSIA